MLPRPPRGTLETIAEAIPGIVDDPKRRRRYAAGLIGLVFVVYGVCFIRLYNAWLGPFPVDTADLGQLESAPLRRWVTVMHLGQPMTSDNLTSLDVIEERVGRRGREFVADYRTLPLPEGKLLVRVLHEPQTAAAIQGVLGANDHAQLAEHGPLLLDLDGNYPLAGWGIGVGGIFAILFALDQMRRASKQERVLPPPLS